MRHAIWKLTALAGVVGIGLLVVMQAQRGLVRQEAAGDSDPAAGGQPGERLAEQRSGQNLQIPQQTEPFGPEGFRDAEPVPASAKTPGGSGPLQNSASALRTNQPVLSSTDPFETPQASLANGSTRAQAAAPPTGLRDQVPIAIDDEPNRGRSGELLQPVEVTPIRPKAAASREVAIQDLDLEQQPGNRQTIRPLPAQPEPGDAEPAEPLPILQGASLGSPQPAPRNALPVDLDEREEQAAGFSAPQSTEEDSAEMKLDVEAPAAAPQRTSQNSLPPAPNLSLIDDDPPAKLKPAAAEREPLFDEDERQPAASAPGATVLGKSLPIPPAGINPQTRANDDDDRFIEHDSQSRSGPRAKSAIAPPSAPFNPPPLPEANEERPMPVLQGTGVQQKPPAFGSIIPEDDDERPAFNSRPRPAGQTEGPPPPANDDRLPVATPLVERPALPRTSGPPARSVDDTDDEAFGVRLRDAGKDVPLATIVKPAPAMNPPPAIEREQFVPQTPIRDTGADRRPINEPQPFRQDLPPPLPQPRTFNDSPPRDMALDSRPAANARGDVYLSAPASERSFVIQNQGTQAAHRPHVTIEKIAPQHAVLGQPMIFHIVVRNAGQTAAQQVIVEDRIPEGLQVSGTIPRAELAGSKLIWRIGRLEAGQEQRFSIRAIPMAEGIVGSVATVNVAAEVGAQTMVTAPKLRLDISAPQRASLGTPVAFNFRVTNVGKGDSSGVIIRNVLPAALRHADGDDLEYEVGVLPAGQSREVQLMLTPSQQGRTVNRAVVTADGGLSVEAQAEVEVVGPSLSVKRAGPKRLFLNKSGVFRNSIANTGSSPVNNITLVETVPPGLDFVSATADGRFDPTKRTVTWRIDRLDAQQSGYVDVTLVSIARGSQVSVVRAYDAGGATGEAMGTTNVTGVSALSIDMSELAAPIEIGERVPCRIRLLNRGSDPALNVRAAVVIPPGLQVVSVKGPGNYRRVQDQLEFEPIARLDSRNEAVIELTVQAIAAGDARVQVLVQSDQMPQPLRREEATTVVAPQ